MNLDFAVQISRLFIPVVAFAGIFIAWQQFQTNREKVRIDLFQRRLDIYKSLLKAVYLTSYFDEDDSGEIFQKLEQAMDEAYFLLPENIYKLIEPIEKRAYKVSDMHWRAGLLQKRLAEPIEERTFYKEGQLEAEYKDLTEAFKVEISWFRRSAHDLLRSSFKEVLGFYKF